MNTQTTVPPVRKTVVVKQSPDRAFALFTGRIGDWWPQTGALGRDSGGPGTVVFEPRAGGQVYRRRADGTIDPWGHVTTWQPPHRLVLAWQPVPGCPTATEVEITFTPQADGTRVDLEHRGWDGHSPDAAASRTQYEVGWGEALLAYAVATRDNAPAIASLVLGITSIVLPILGLIAAPFAIVLGLRGRRRARDGAGQAGLATIGLTLGAIGLALWSVLLVLGAGLIMQSVDGTDEPVPVESVQVGP
jgi:uncharacterized protein YndB with AHSA1/START domain